jgi:hypothetical protein
MALWAKLAHLQKRDGTPKHLPVPKALLLFCKSLFLLVEHLQNVPFFTGFFLLPERCPFPVASFGIAKKSYSVIVGTENLALTGCLVF